MDPQALLEQAAGVESVGHDQGVVLWRVPLRQTRRQVEVGLSLVMVSG